MTILYTIIFGLTSGFTKNRTSFLLKSQNLERVFILKTQKIVKRIYFFRMRCGYRRIGYAPMSTGKIFYTFSNTEQFCSVFSTSK